jgi:hypothetical protein
MGRRIRIGVLLAIVVCVCGGTRARADVPAFLTQQGRLFDSSNMPVTGMTTFVFSLYTAASGGTAAWTETQSITLDSGYFSAQLGEVTAIPPATFVNAASMGQTLYLGIKVNTDPELSPRQPLLSVPYALVAQNAIGDITPHTVSVNGKQVIDSMGNWVGPATGHPVMASGAIPAATMGQIINATGSGDNHIWPVTLTATQLGTATQCMVTATGNVCGHPEPIANSYTNVFAAYQPVGGMAMDSPHGAWLSPPFANTTPNNYSCSAGTTSFTWAITPGTSYNFGCDIGSLITVPGNGASNPGGGGYCQTSVVCF